MTRFEPTSPLRGGKVRCTVCGAAGWPGGAWQAKHRAGHPHTCPCHGRRWINLSALSAHVTPRRAKEAR